MHLSTSAKHSRYAFTPVTYTVYVIVLCYFLDCWQVLWSDQFGQLGH